MERLTGLDGLQVLDPDGAPHPVTSLWEERPVVLALIRHFG